MSNIKSVVSGSAQLEDSVHLMGPLSVAETQRQLHIERARSNRTGLDFCLLAISASAGNRKPLDWNSQLQDYLLQRLRITDVVGRLDDRTLGVILSATDRSGAARVTDDIKNFFAEKFELQIQIYNYPDGYWPNHGDRDSEREDQPERPIATLFARPMPLWKRSIDVVFSLFALVALLPLLLMIAMMIKLTSKGPVFFTQIRSGLGGRRFKMFKFRTMIVDAVKLRESLDEYSVQDGPAFKMEDDPRVTRVGRILRAMRLDELPQFWNVLRGHMTIVGPRPLPHEETVSCEDWQLERLDVVPGLTCTWQVLAERVAFVEWMRMDIRYLRHHSLMRDLGLVLRTAYAMVVQRDGK